jgi:hypothetical protein
VEIPSGREYLRLFLLAEDPDGPADIESLHLYNDARELVWIIGADKLIHRTERGENWYGYPRFELPDGGTLPRNLYRAVLLDKGGKSGEYVFRIERSTGFNPEELNYRLLDQKPEPHGSSFPGIQISGDTERFIDLEFRFSLKECFSFLWMGPPGSAVRGRSAPIKKRCLKQKKKRFILVPLYVRSQLFYGNIYRSLSVEVAALRGAFT